MVEGEAGGAGGVVVAAVFEFVEFADDDLGRG